MKIALLMNKNAYSGREYADALFKKKISFDVISIGSFPDFDPVEEKRCGGNWKPKSEDELFFDIKRKTFSRLSELNLIEYINDEAYDIGIQGGVGIIKPNLINAFKSGILNFHPGNLPDYRGCSAPEWQLFEGKEIISTCHFIDSGIDTGPILMRKVLNVNMKNYEEMRSSIYPETALFLAEVIDIIKNNPDILNSLEIQDINTGKYREYIGDERIELLKSSVFNTFF
jgi:folate-dependent phosphoribosylglycinamide formyltransferase PurN